MDYISRKEKSKRGRTFEQIQTEVINSRVMDVTLMHKPCVTTRPARHKLLLTLSRNHFRESILKHPQLPWQHKHRFQS